MSRLSDKFQKAAKLSVQTMGFRTSQKTVQEPGLLLIVSATPEALKNKADMGKAGAILIRPESAPVTPESARKIAEMYTDMPVGVYIEDADEKETDSIAEAGCDFLVFPPSCRIFNAAEEKKTGRIIQVESSMDDSLLRAVNSLPVDAVIAADTFTGGAMSWHELLIFQHLANSFNKPLIVNIPPDVTEAELKALFEAGADGVIAENSAMKTGGLKKLQELIGRLPPRSARKRGKVDVTLPHGGGAAPPAPGEEEEEEEE
jgi:hypothetical protein